MIASLLLSAAFMAELPVSARIVEIGGAPHIQNEPEFVAEGVSSAVWSPDGTQLMSVSIRPRPNLFSPPTKDSRIVISFWSSTTRRSVGEYIAPAGHSVREMKWEGKSGSAILNLNTEEETKFIRVLPNGKSTELPVPDAKNVWWQMQTSRFEPGLLLMGVKFGPREEDREASYQLLFYPGNGGQPVSVSGLDAKSRMALEENFGVAQFQRGEGVGRFRLDTNTGKFVPGSPPPAPRSAAMAVNGQGVALITELKNQVSLESWWVTGTDERQAKPKYPAALITPKASAADVSDTSQNIWYLDSGNLFVRRLVKISQDQVDDLLECEERMTLLSDAKQVGTGIMIFMADNDDDFPPAKEWRAKVYPYVKNDKLLDGFVFSYKGPANATQVAEPSKTELGYKEGRFGRAVVRTDSSAIWEPRRKRTTPLNCGYN